MTWHNTILLPKKKKKKSRRSGDFLHLFNLVFRAAILDLPVDLPCHSIYTDLVEQPDLQDLVMSMLPEEVMGLQVIRWWPVHHQRRRHHLRLTWVNYAAPAKKGTNCCCFQSSFSFLLSSTGLRSPLYSLSHTQYPYSMLGAADQLAAWYDDYYTFSNLFTFFIISSSNRLMEKAEILYLGEKST